MNPVGLIGVGAIGMAITCRLVAAGHPPTGYRRGSLDAFAAAGGIPASSAAEAASASQLMLLLPTDEALADVMRQIAPAMHPGQIVLCLGSHRLPAKRAAADDAARAGAILLDGEVSGTPGMLRAGQASVLIAGDPDAIGRVRPLLDLFARTVTGLGAFGNASRMKLVTNYLVGVHTAAAAEALILAEHLGLAPSQAVDAITPSAGGSTMFAVRGRMMADGRLPDGDMPSFVHYYDLLHDALPNLTASGAPLLSVVEGLFRRAIVNGHGDRDIAAIYDDCRTHAGRTAP